MNLLRILALALLLPPAVFAAEGASPDAAAPGAATAKDGGDRPIEQALELFKKSLPTPAFSEARLSAGHQLLLEANEEFLNSPRSKQAGFVKEAFEVWDADLRKADQENSQPYVIVMRPDGGSLWRLRASEALLIDQWSEIENFNGEDRPRSGRIFGFFGGQKTTGKEADVAGWNARLGTTLLHDQYDLALEYNYQADNKAVPKNKYTSYGLIGRRLFQISPRVGFNLGTQLILNSAAGKSARWSFSGVAGLSFFLTGGSLDVSLNAADHNVYGALLGYTVFLTKK